MSKDTTNVIHVDFGLDPCLNKGDFVKLKCNGHHGIVIEVNSRFEDGPAKGQAMFLDIGVPLQTEAEEGQAEAEEGEWLIVNDVYVDNVVRVISKHASFCENTPQMFNCENELIFEENDNGY